MALPRGPAGQKLPHLFEVFDYAKTIGIMPLCTPWDMVSLERLENYGIEGYKISSADLTNHQLLKAELV